jgi:uncharacterized protein YceH (UPF0502 family)
MFVWHTAVCSAKRKLLYTDQKAPVLLCLCQAAAEAVKAELAASAVASDALQQQLAASEQTVLQLRTQLSDLVPRHTR